jgi:hypothetical protein
MVGFSSYKLITLEYTLEAIGYKTFMIDFLKNSFFINSIKGIGILILINSCSRMTEDGGLSTSFISGVACLDEGGC